MITPTVVIWFIVMGFPCVTIVTVTWLRNRRQSKDRY
jgi:hypothetical protein